MRSKAIKTALLAMATGTSMALATAHAAPITSSFVVTGAVDQSTTETDATLDALPSQTANVTYLANGQPVSATFTGPTLWSVLGKAGLRTTPGVKNATLRDVVVAKGSDGYAVAFSAGELDPRFGGKTAPDLIAIRQNGQPLDQDGFARTVVPGDKRGGRYVSNLSSLDVVQAPSNPSHGGGPSTQFTLSGRVQQTTTFNLSKLTAMASVTEQVSYTSAGQPVTASFTGVPLWDLLQAVGLVTDPTIKNDELRNYVLATGSDGYEATFSLGELDPRFGGSTAMPDLVAYAVNGSPLGDDGFARLVVPGDAAGGRYVSNIVSLQVLSATLPAPVPLPGSLPLLACGLLGLAVVRCKAKA